MSGKIFAGQTCLVTGGTQGIGLALAQAFATRGARVFACGRSEGNLRRAAEQVRDLPYGGRIQFDRVDVTDRPLFEAWIAETYRKTGRIDVLINNAAYVQWTDVSHMSVEQAQQTMRVAYDGMVVGIKAVLPLMEQAGRGHIVNMGSIAGRIFVGGSSAAYAAAKAAIDAYSVTLQLELAETPLNLLLVRLGTVAGTDFFKKHVSEERMPPLTRFMPALTPPRVAEAVARAVADSKPILTLPRYLSLLTHFYALFPRFSRWLAHQGGQRRRGYDAVQWRYHRGGSDDLEGS